MEEDRTGGRDMEATMRPVPGRGGLIGVRSRALDQRRAGAPGRRVRAHPAVVAATSVLGEVPSDAEVAEAVRHPGDRPTLHRCLIGLVNGDAPPALVFDFAQAWNIDDETLLRLCAFIDDLYGPQSSPLRRALAVV